VFYLGLAPDSAYIEGFVEGCLERIGEDDSDEAKRLRTPVLPFPRRFIAPAILLSLTSLTRTPSAPASLALA
jgi:hypothetical protein